MVAIISYLLLKFYLMHLKMQKGGEIDKSERAKAIAKVTKVVNMVDFVLILWFTFLLGLILLLFVTTTVALGVSLLGYAPESAWIASIQHWEVDTITQIVGEYGLATSLALLTMILGVGAIVIYSILMLFFKKKRK